MSGFDIPPPPLEDAPPDVKRTQILRRHNSSNSSFGSSFGAEQERARISSSGKRLLVRALSGNDNPTSFAWGNVNNNPTDYEQFYNPVKSTYEIREKKTGKVLKEPPKDWGWDNKWSRGEVTAEQQFNETVRDELIDFLVVHLPSKIHLIDDLVDKWAGQEEQLFRFLEEEFGNGDSVVPGQKGAVKKEDREDYIFKKLTDTKLYTGASRQRFDSKGVGIGAEGRGGEVFSSFKGNTNEKSDDVGPMDACDFLNRKWS
ncbi:hypothetical protein TrVE_jg12924 [Triparma verrucosa]|uniref:Uncharacterized protein n=1 Tax=Triparma verrucosa TaxID=1606542 RepID=A0A9W7C508_9STRA|nr:hypothetical protein TrVE_jg12924 [Triparma verrucosa]